MFLYSNNRYCDKQKDILASKLSYVLYTLPAEWIFTADWLKIANIDFKSLFQNYIPNENPDIFAFNILGLKCCYYP